jgi:hypothetical protein
MHFLAPEMLPYTVAFMIFTIFAFLEFITLLVGLTLFSFLDDVFLSSHGDIDGETSIGSFFAYVNPKEVPLSMLLVSFFFIFSFMGALLQTIFGLLPLFVSLPLAVVLTFFLLRYMTTIIGNLLPKESSEVVSTDSFIGKKAFILDPKAKRNLPARAKVQDVYGETHYISVEPLSVEDIFYEGDTVLIIEKSNLIFLVEKSLKF